MAQQRLRRPSNAMMLAVNAAIDKRDKEVAQLLTEHDLESAELEQRIKLRNGRLYDLNGSTQRPSRRAKADGSNGESRLDVAINGRTSVRRLFHLIEHASQTKAAAQQELARRPPADVDSVKKAFAEIEVLRREREKLEARIRDAEQALG